MDKCAGLNTQSIINTKDEARIKLEFQSMAVVKHFRHSKSCTPLLIDRVTDIKTIDLRHYK
jgi:hypothetical protein